MGRSRSPSVISELSATSWSPLRRPRAAFSTERPRVVALTRTIFIGIRNPNDVAVLIEPPESRFALGLPKPQSAHYLSRTQRPGGEFEQLDDSRGRAMLIQERVMLSHVHASCRSSSHGSRTAGGGTSTFALIDKSDYRVDSDGNFRSLPPMQLKLFAPWRHHLQQESIDDRGRCRGLRY
jgi:hypothetical protein